MDHLKQEPIMSVVAAAGATAVSAAPPPQLVVQPQASTQALSNAAAPPTENKFMIMGYDVVFPQGKKPFPAQLAVMSKVLLALKSGQHALLESPTGSGKTLALLCSSLTFQRQFVKEMVENERIRAEQAATKAPSPEKEREQATKMESGDDATMERMSRAKDEDKDDDDDDDDDDDFASTQPTFEQFRFGNGGVLKQDGWISMEDKKRTAGDATDGTEPPAKRRTLPGSFNKVLKTKISSDDLADFHSVGGGDPTANASTTGRAKRILPPKIFFCSRTHSQLAQVVDELKSCPVSYLASPDVANPFADSLKTCVLGSKSHYCVNSKVNRDPAQLDDKCRDAVESNQCSYFRKRRKTNDLRRVAPPVWDLEDLVQLAKKHRECAFYHARDALAEANIVFCPYNYLLDPSIRDAVNISIKDAIIVLDEAHNVEDTCRSSASLELTIEVLVGAIGSFTDVIKHGSRPPVYLGLLKVLNGVHRWLKSIAASSATILKPTGYEEESKVWTGADCIAMFAEFASMTKENFEQLKKDMAAVMEHEKELAMDAQQQQRPSGKDDEEGSDRRLSALAIGTIRKVLNVADYMFRDELKYLDDFKLIVMKSRPRQRQSMGGGSGRGGGGRYGGRGGRGGGRGGYSQSYSQSGYGYSQADDSGGGWQVKMCIWCLNAAVAFSDVVKQARSVILTSGTLSPMDSFAGELGTDFPIRLEANHVVNIRRQVFIGAVMHGPGGVDLSATFKNQQEFRYQDSMGELLLQYAQVVPGGVLMFFPSYSLMDKLQTRWRQTGVWTRIEQTKTVFTEPRTAGKDFDALLDEYKHTIYQCMAAMQNDSASSSSPVKAEPVGHHRGVSLEDTKYGVKSEPGAAGWSGMAEPGTSTVRKTGAIFLAVYRGKVSEGIDFSNANARAVLAVGIPYPNVKELQVLLKRQYQDEKSKVDRVLVTGSAWYQLQAFRALNQALGRCIRHRQDYGAIILVDSRYRFQAHTKSLSKWIRPFVREFEHAHDSLPMLGPFFEMNSRELGVGMPDIQVAQTAAAAAAVSSAYERPWSSSKKPLALKYEPDAASAAPACLQSTVDSVRAYLAKTRGADDPQIFSIFAGRKDASASASKKDKKDTSMMRL